MRDPCIFYICVPIFHLGGPRFGVGVWLMVELSYYHRLFLDALLVKMEGTRPFSNMCCVACYKPAV